jgi:putative aldouronate transport system permease protein
MPWEGKACIELSAWRIYRRYRHIMKTIYKNNIISRITDLTIWLIVGLFALICLLPFIFVITYSITPYVDYLKNPLNLLPRNITFDAYQYVFDFKMLWSGFYNTVFITVTSVILEMFVLLITAYPLSKRNLKGTRFIMLLFIITMFFHGGMIPDYFVIRKLNLINSLWSLILPSLCTAYRLILMRSFISNIPDSMEESAIIDGATPIQVLFRIIAPLSKPAIATLTLFMAVTQWNSYFKAILYITKRAGWPLQLVLREIIHQGESMFDIEMQAVSAASIVPFNIKMASIITTMLPILCVYPFMQKYFVKGIMLGAIKG